MPILNVPTLRFPEFSDEWIENRLVEVTSKVNSGKTPLGGEAVYTDEGVLFIRSQNVVNDKLDLENSTYIPTHVNEGMKNSVVEANDILLNITGASLGRSCVVPENFIKGNVNQHVCIIRTKDGYNPKFIQPFFSSKRGQSLFQSLQTGSGREGLNFENIKNIKIAFPTLAEQNKIAKFLEIIQYRIETQNKIIEQLESLIKALNVKLIDGTIKFKYKNGVSFPNWEPKALNEIAYKKSSNISANSLENETGIYKIYGANGVIKHISYFEEENCYISIVKDGAGVGRLYFCDAKSSVLGTLDKIMCLDYFDLKYIYYLLSTIDFSKYKTGSTIPHIYFKDYSNESFPIPCYEEQRLIATILSDLDSKKEVEQLLMKYYLFQKDFFLNNLFK